MRRNFYTETQQKIIATPKRIWNKKIVILGTTTTLSTAAITTPIAITLMSNDNNESIINQVQSNEVTWETLDEKFIETLFETNDRYGKIGPVFRPIHPVKNVTFALKQGTYLSPKSTGVNATVEAFYDDGVVQEFKSFNIHLSPKSLYQVEWEELSSPELAFWANAGVNKGDTEIPSGPKFDSGWVTVPDGIKIPAEITKIGDEVFKNATIEGSIIWPLGSNITKDDYNNDFAGSLSPLSIGQSLFEGATFQNLSTGTFKLPQNLNVIPANFMKDAIFENIQSLSDDFWPKNLKGIESGAFENFEPNTEFDSIPVSVEWIGSRAFYGAKISSNFSIPQNTRIDSNAFGNANIAPGFTLPNNVVLGINPINNAPVTSWATIFENITGWSTGVVAPGARKQ